MPMRKLSVEAYRAERVPCPDCGSEVRRTKLRRHRDGHLLQRSVSSVRCRATTLTEQPATLSRHSSMDSVAIQDFDGCSSIIDSRRPMVRQSSVNNTFAGLSRIEYLVASAAASAVTERHEAYNINSLCNYVMMEFPEIPAVARPYLVIGAAAGAQHAAQIHFLAETHAASPESSRRELARSARCSLSAWSAGLQFDPNPSTSVMGMARPELQIQLPDTPRVMSMPVLPSNPLAENGQCRSSSEGMLHQPSNATSNIEHDQIQTLDELNLPVSRDVSDQAFNDIIAEAARQVGLAELTRWSSETGTDGSQLPSASQRRVLQGLTTMSTVEEFSTTETVTGQSSTTENGVPMPDLDQNVEKLANISSVQAAVMNDISPTPMDMPVIVAALQATERDQSTAAWANTNVQSLHTSVPVSTSNSSLVASVSINGENDVVQRTVSVATGSTADLVSPVVSIAVQERDIADQYAVASSAANLSSDGCKPVNVRLPPRDIRNFNLSTFTNVGAPVSTATDSSAVQKHTVAE